MFLFLEGMSDNWSRHSMENLLGQDTSEDGYAASLIDLWDALPLRSSEKSQNCTLSIKVGNFEESKGQWIMAGDGCRLFQVQEWELRSLS